MTSPAPLSSEKRHASSCPYCAAEGLKGFMYPDSGGHVRTLAMPYDRVDPKTGEITRVDPNTYTTTGRCTNGHHWAVRSSQRGGTEYIHQIAVTPSGHLTSTDEGAE